ncbi:MULTISPECIES: hypothetical protein [Kribbella]|uniref:hypothetical protein n=1 Tax=Kribbella TaxID=182639 RepID=UPI001EE11B6C|nr:MULTISPECIES: hypothetical protein [Kribbella]
MPTRTTSNKRVWGKSVALTTGPEILTTLPLSVVTCLACPGRLGSTGSVRGLVVVIPSLRWG